MSTEQLQNLISAAAELGANMAIRNLGIKACKMSYTDAKQTYGKDFLDAYKEQRIFPCKIDGGHRGTKWFNVSDILTVIAANEAKAQLIIK